MLQAKTVFAQLTPFGQISHENFSWLGCLTFCFSCLFRVTIAKVMTNCVYIISSEKAAVGLSSVQYLK